MARSRSEACLPPAEVAKVPERLAGRRLQDVAGTRTLERDRRDALGDLLDLDLEAPGVQAQPAEGGVGGREPPGRLVEPRQRPVVEPPAVLVAPGGIDDLPDRDSRHVPRDHAIEEPCRVPPPDQVL